jgi:16S rRNA (uracil1498-N3)-methyltransferase
VVIVIDGLGVAYRGEICELRPRSGVVEVRIRDTIRGFGEPSTRLTLAAGLSTGAKFDTIVEKGTEVGVTRFVPLLSEKSKVRLEDPKRARNKARRLERVALAATKQCRRSYRPEIAEPCSVETFVRESQEDELKLCFHTDRSGTPLEDVSLNDLPRRASVLVGPESGFSPDEVDLIAESGFQIVSLGRRILRTETAGPLAAALVLYRLGELR